MSKINLKNVYNKILDKVLGPMCKSGLSHRERNRGMIINDKYCLHEDCKRLRLVNLEIELIRRSLNFNLQKAEVELNIQKNKNNTAFNDGCIHGINMERAKIYETLGNSKKLLLDLLSSFGVAEARVPQYIDWFERVRVAEVSPKQDIITYNICKNIVEINTAMQELQKDTQFT